MVGFAAKSTVDVGLIGFAAAAHAHVGQCTAGGFTDGGVCGVGGVALRRMHGDGIAEADMPTQVVAFEDDARIVGAPFGGDAVGHLVDAGDAPAIAVAHPVGIIATGIASRTFAAPVCTDRGFVTECACRR